MLPPGLNSPQEVSAYYDGKYFQAIRSGQAHPFVYPLATFGTFVVFLYLLIDHRGSRLQSSSRYVVFILYSIFQAWCILTNVARNPASAYGIGLISIYSWLWVAVHLVVNDCQADYKRIERRATGQNGITTTALFWQAYPSRFTDRLSWVVDMFISFRGVGWNWQTGGVPDAPSWVQAQLKGQTAQPTDETTVSRTGLRRISNRGQLVKESLWQVLIGYLVLDILKTLAMYDPYFWGYTDDAGTVYPSIIRDSYILLRSIRLMGVAVCTSTALWMIFKLGPVFFAGILGPTFGIRGEAWMNPPDMFGPLSNVLDKGLAGFWGGFWHQVFRYTFEAPGTRLLEVLKIDKRSTAGKLIGLAVAFTISGSIHACGSYTQTGDTRPIRGPFMFFIMQGVGIAIETLLQGALKGLPKTVRRILNSSFTLIWLYQTGHLLCDDFSQGGVWLFEPVPISIFRGLGLGTDPGWLRWTGRTISWHTGRYWVDSGLTL